MKIDLKNTTFIIPVYIESSDRKTNAIITLSYLTKYFDTNIIILEHDKESKMANILEEIGLFNDPSIMLIFSKNESGNDIFHRTRFLNEMLVHVKTPVVVNYDIDVLLEPEVYLECQNKILNENYDLIYPYFFGKSQRQVNNNGKQKILNTLNLKNLVNLDFNTTISEYGHCQFFNTISYRNGGMENESFMSYGPEDKERGYRFKTLGYKVSWLNHTIYHIEHSRGINSTINNPYTAHNNSLFELLKKYTATDLHKYYSEAEYKKKYNIDVVIEQNIAKLIFYTEVTRWFADNGDLTHRLNYDLDENSVVLDIGGFKGNWASDIFSKHLSNIKVFEPIKEYYNFIINRFSKNPKITVSNIAFGNKNSTDNIIVLSESSSLHIDPELNSNFESIEIINFNEYLDTSNPIDLVKINIEGSEYDLLECISIENIKKLKNIQIQFHPFVVNCITRRDKIRDMLKLTHECTYCYEFVWENWKLKT